jgi:SAM-dependent methyltransferase
MKRQLKKIVPYNFIHFIKKTKCILEAYFYKGHNFECPLCKKKFRKLKDGGEALPFFKNHKVIGGGRRKNMLCPYCLSTDRDRLVYFYLISKKELLQNDLILLHVAPEPSLKKYIKQHSNITYYSGDKFEERYQGFYYDKGTLNLDLTDLQYPDELFDIIICNHVLEHIKDDTKAIQEIKRVLKPNGWAILQVPISKDSQDTIEYQLLPPEKRKSIYGQEDHVRLYGLDYPERLKSQGLKVAYWKASDFLNASEISKFAINNEEKVYIVRK